MKHRLGRKAMIGSGKWRLMLRFLRRYREGLSCKKYNNEIMIMVTPRQQGEKKKKERKSSYQMHFRV